MFGPKMKKVTCNWRNRIIPSLFALFKCVFTLIKSRRVRWATHVAQTGQSNIAYRIWVRNVKEKRYLEELGIDGREILKWGLVNVTINLRVA
jgi:hypothetical protein